AGASITSVSAPVTSTACGPPGFSHTSTAATTAPWSSSSTERSVLSPGEWLFVALVAAALGGAWYGLVLRPRRREARRAAWRTEGLAPEARKALFEDSP